MKRDPDWKLWISFLAVLQTGSLSGAARIRATTQPRVRRHVEQLEEELGVVLFTRSTSGLVPTEVARSMRSHAETMQAAAAAMVRQATDISGEAIGTVRLSCSEIVGVEIVPSLLSRLLTEHPQLQIELVASNISDDLLRSEADVAIRMTRPTQGALVARRLCDVRLGLFATAAYLSRTGVPTTLQALRTEHRLIGDDRRGTIARAVGLHGLDDLRWGFRSDQDLAQLAAIKAGIGIGVCQLPLAARYNLVAVLPELSLPLDVWLVMHEDLCTSRRVRTVFDYLATSLPEYLDMNRHDRC